MKKFVAVSLSMLVISAVILQPATAGERKPGKGQAKATTTSPAPTQNDANTPVAGCTPTTSRGHKPMKFAIPTYKAPQSTMTFTFKTNCGDIVVQADGKNAPVTVFILAVMAKVGYYDKSICHRLTTSLIYVLQCGDPTATGQGGPNFRFDDENLPTNVPNNYPAGTVAMANSGLQPNGRGTNGSQFFFVYGDTTLPPNYTRWGTITQGLDILKAVAARGATGKIGDGKPKQTIAIESVSVK